MYAMPTYLIKQVTQHVHNAHIELCQHGVALQQKVLVSPHVINSIHDVPKCISLSFLIPTFHWSPQFLFVIQDD